MPLFHRTAIFWLVSVAWTLPAVAQGGGKPAGPGGPGGIYSCTDAKGRRYTSDRPVPECQDREQRMLNNDGSVRKVLPPAMTPSERTEADARELQATQLRAAQQEAARRDRMLMLRYPNQAAHDAARNAALDDLRQSIALIERRLATLVEERKPLVQEATSHVKTPVPLKLRQQINANEAATGAQRDLVQAQQTELVRLTERYDAELATLKRLWGGTAPGSVAPASAVSVKVPAK
jgi:hypothetical protein